MYHERWWVPAAQDGAPGSPTDQLRHMSPSAISLSAYQPRRYLLFSAAIPALLYYCMEAEQFCVSLLPAAHLFQAPGGAVASQAVIPKPKLSLPIAQFSRSGLWSCFSWGPRRSSGHCPHHLLLFLSSAELLCHFVTAFLFRCGY